jgi:hypothetical protein
MRCACCVGARCVLHRRALHRSNTSLCMLHQHVASMRVASVHRCALRAAPVPSHVASCIGKGGALHRRALAWACCISVCCTLHRRVLHVASVRVARCVGDVHPSRSARSSSPLCSVCLARALLDWVKAALLRRPSGGAMHSCAGLRRRAPHEQGLRAVRGRGDIWHRSKGACKWGRQRVGAGVGGRCRRARLLRSCVVSHVENPHVLWCMLRMTLRATWQACQVV